MRQVQVLLHAVPVCTRHQLVRVQVLQHALPVSTIHHLVRVQVVPHRVIILRVPTCRISTREFLRVPVQVKIRLLYLRVASYVNQSSQIIYGLPPVCANQAFIRSFLRIMSKFHQQASLHFLSLGRLSPLEGDYSP